MRSLVGILALALIAGISIAEEELAPRIVDGRVLFSCRAPDAGEVYLAGTFNGWDAQRDLMERGGDGVWRLEVELSAGSHEYKFVIDGSWTTDPNAIETVPDPYGGKNSVVTLVGTGTDLKIMETEEEERAPERSVIPYLSGRYVATLITRKDSEAGDKYRLTRPEHDIRLDFTVDLGSNVEAWAETRINTLEDDPVLKLQRGHASVDAQFGKLLAFGNELAVRFDEPLGLVGRIGEFEEPFGEDARGLFLTSRNVTPYRVRLLGFYADDTKEVDRSGLRLEAGDGWKLGATFRRTKPTQAIPVLGYSIPLSEEWDTENFAFLPGSWWIQFYPEFYDSTGGDTKSNDAYYYFHFADFEPLVYSDDTYAIDGSMRMLSEHLRLYGAYAFRARPSFRGVSDMHTTEAGPVVDTTAVVFHEKYSSHEMLGGVEYSLPGAMEIGCEYSIEKGDLTTNLGGETDDPVRYEPTTSLLSGRIGTGTITIPFLESMTVGLGVTLERNDLLDGFDYGDDQAFYDYLRVDRHGYVDNFYALYLRNTKETITLHPHSRFSLLGYADVDLSFKVKRYTCQRLTLSGSSLSWADYAIDARELIAESSLPLTEKLKALINVRLQTYESSQDDYLFFRHHFSETYLELAYSLSPNVRFTASYGVDPWDRTDRYGRKRGRENFLAGQISSMTDVPNYGKGNDQKMDMIREAEEALEKESRVSLTVEVDF